MPLRSSSPTFCSKPSLFVLTQENHKILSIAQGAVWSSFPPAVHPHCGPSGVGMSWFFQVLQVSEGPLHILILVPGMLFPLPAIYAPSHVGSNICSPPPHQSFPTSCPRHLYKEPCSHPALHIPWFVMILSCVIILLVFDSCTEL